MTLAPGDSGWAFTFSAVRAHGLGLSAGDSVAVEQSPEGPRNYGSSFLVHAADDGGDLCCLPGTVVMPAVRLAT